MRLFISTAVVIWSLTFNINAQEASLNWMTVEEVTEAQKTDPRKVMMDVYTKWCGPCKMMMANTFTDVNLINYVNSNYYAVKLDAEFADPIVYQGKEYSNPNYDPSRKGRNGVHELSLALGVKAYPTIVFMDEKLKVLAPISGYKQPNQMEVYLKFFHDEYSNDIAPEKMQPIWDNYRDNFSGSW